MKRRFFILAALLGLASFLRADSDVYKKIAQDLARDLIREKGARIAVFPIPHHDGHPSEGPLLVSERLATYLGSEKHLTLVERGHMEDLLRECHLSAAGLVDPRAAKKMGSMLGADIIITGTLIDLPDGFTEANIRAILLSSGRIVSASRAMVNRTWETRPRLDAL